MIHKSIFIILLSFVGFSIVPVTLSFAQTPAEEAVEQNQSEREQRQEELAEERQPEETPKTAEEVLELLKKRVEEKKAEQWRKDILKTRISSGVTQIFETNPTSAGDGASKDDPSNERTFGFNWTPKFSQNLSGNLGYSLTDVDYSDNPTLNSFDQTITGDTTYRMFNGKLSLTPGLSYEWMVYPKSESSSFEQKKAFLRYTYYLNTLWNVGGKYEYSDKWYDHDLARDSSAADIVDLHREDNRHTAELWVKRFIGKYSIQLKGKSYRNVSNDDYQNYNDYDTHKGEVTLSGSFLTANKLSLSYTADYEAKHYFDRIAVDTARSDRVNEHRLSTNYSLTKNLKLNYTVSYKLSSSNAPSGEFENFTNKIGLSVNF